MIKWKPAEGYKYVERKQMSDGIYSGYMMGEERHGAGTLVDKNMRWRMEGIWCKNFGFIGCGIKEFNDGEVQQGKFVKSRFQEVSRLY